MSKTKLKKLERERRYRERVQDSKFIASLIARGGDGLGKAQTRGRFKSAARHLHNEASFHTGTWIRNQTPKN